MASATVPGNLVVLGCLSDLNALFGAEMKISSVVTIVRWSKRILSVLLAATFTMGISGCGETDRPLSYDKGTYGGPVDEKLNDDVVRALEQRSNYQRSTF